MQRILISYLLVIGFSCYCYAQVAGFFAPDTVCMNKPVVISNVQPPSATSYKWSFCTGNAFYEPDGINLGNPNQLLNAPRFITLVQDSLDYYSFTTNSGNANVVRCYYGATLSLSPSAITNLGNFNLFTNEMGGIQVKKENGNWYGFVSDGARMIRLDFGNSLLNTPGSHAINLPGVNRAFGLAITRQNTNWVGFCTDLESDSLFRLEFTAGLSNDPVVTNLGNIGFLNAPASIIIAQENSLWYAFICNYGNSTISRIEFGTSLLNPNPSGANLTSIGGLNVNAGITLINDCGSINGFVTNNVNQSDQCIVHLVFANGLGGTVTGYQIENNGILNKPFGISEVVRQSGTLYAFVANSGSSSVTRMFFPSCSEVSLPFWTGPDPPPVTYQAPGKYNIQLTVNEGSPDESSQCNHIVVLPTPDVSLGPDRSLCQGDSLRVNPDAESKFYLWSTGAQTSSIAVDTSGTYWVQAVSSFDCEDFDTIQVTVNKSAAVRVDTTICEGLSYWAQQAMQSSSGTYFDTLQMATGCDSVITTNLSVRDCPLLIWFPNAFTPNGDGLNDFFRPVGTNITKYKLLIFDRWGALIFESADISTGWNGYVNGRAAAPDIYTFHVTFETIQYPGETHREKGTFLLSK